MPIFQIEVQEPYPQLSGGQKIGALEVLPNSTVELIPLDDWTCAHDPNTGLVRYKEYE